MKQLVTERLMTLLNTLCMNSIKKIGVEVHFVGKGNIKQIKSRTTQGLNKNSPGHRVGLQLEEMTYGALQENLL